MCFEHERIHLETSSVLMRELPLACLAPPPAWPRCHASAHDAAAAPPPNDLLTVPAGDALLGKPAGWPSYGWDNEYGARTFHVREFRASRTLVRCASVVAAVACVCRMVSFPISRAALLPLLLSPPLHFTAPAPARLPCLPRLLPSSNAEFLEFVRDGGYRSEQWWGAEGWRWRTFRNAKWPTFWVPDGPQGG